VTADRSGPVLVVGGAGYIGSVLVRQLLEKGARVRVLDALLYDNEPALSDFAAHAGFEFMGGDLRDPDATAHALEGVSRVVLLAALVGDPVCRAHPDLARDINLTGTTRFFDSLIGRRLDRIVFMSTCSNYGLRETEAEANEESELKPVSLYAETKVAVERHILGALGRLDFHPTILRAATAYGGSPRMRLDLTVNEFVYELAQGRELLVYDADTWRPYCHVEDICHAIAAVLDSPADVVSGQVFNVGRPGENHTKRMLVGTILAAVPEGKVRYREGAVDPRNYRVSFDKIESRLGFRAERNVAGSIKELVSLFRDLNSNPPPRGNPFYNNILK
jgi:nucleoside-diphosphate-sugar epimerase